VDKRHLLAEEEEEAARGNSLCPQKRQVHLPFVLPLFTTLFINAGLTNIKNKNFIKPTAQLNR